MWSSENFPFTRSSFCKLLSDAQVANEDYRNNLAFNLYKDVLNLGSEKKKKLNVSEWFNGYTEQDVFPNFSMLQNHESFC